ncbi:MAG: NAD(P)/FAD-dependent oxidoreductase [Myxococcales bacterium]|nr:NAD(P)/FAD-dependent oxidoreductase [Myxococcales bacterium]
MSRTSPRRDRPWSRTSPDGPWDAVVIGSGMGGMTTAALLADRGKRVLVLEQHYVPGGFTHMFKRPGFEWDVGVHAVGEVTERSMTGRLLHHLTRGRLRWASLGEVYDEFHYPDGLRLDFPDNPRQFRDNLVEAFPNGRAAIDGYLEKVRAVSGSMKAYYLARTLPPRVAPLSDRLLARRAQRHLTTTTAKVMAGLTDDPRLTTALCAQWGYYGSPPSRSSFAIQALVAKHFQWGGYYPVGGAKQIARALLQTVADAGGWTRINADVAEIVVEGGRAVGVRLCDGEQIGARHVISAVGIGATVRRLLPPAEREAAWVREVTALAPAPAHVCLYLGFEGDIRRAGASAANKWFYETWSAEAEAWQVKPDGRLPEAPVLYCSFPSLKDPEHDPGPAEHHTGEVVTFVPWDVFAPWRGSRWKKRGEDYDQLKQRLTDALLDQFLTHMPELRSMIRHAELSTPVSTDHFCRPLRGSIYGLEPTPERFRCRWLRPGAPLQGLHFSGSEVATVGVIGAMMGGVLAALAAEPLEVMRTLEAGGAFGHR